MDVGSQSVNARRAMSAAVFAVAFLFVHSHPVVADHNGVPFGSLRPCGGTPRNCVSVADNATHLVYFSSVGEGMYNATINTMNEDYNPTDMNMWSTTYWQTADVWVYDADYGQNGAAGWVDCPANAPQGVNARGDAWCKNQTLKYNITAAYRPFWEDAGSRAYLACHEMGHTMGLQHWWGSGTCMFPDAPNGPQNLDPVDRGHINGYY